MKTSVATAIALVGSTLCLACGPGEATPRPSGAEDFGALFDPDADPVATDAEQATAFTNDRATALIDGLADAMAAVDTSRGTSVVDDGAAAVFDNDCAGPGTVDTSDLLDLGGLEDTLRELRSFLEEEVFRPEFVESDDGRTVTYLIDPASACDDDVDCVSKLNTNPLRFAVNVLDDGSVLVHMLVGTARQNPVTLRMSDTALGLRADLGEAMGAVTLFVDPAERDELPSTLEGVVELALVKDAEGVFTLGLSLLEDLRLEVEPEPGKAVSVNVEASRPTSELHLDANAKSLSWRQNLATMDIAAAGSLFCEDDSDCGTKERTGTFRLHLAGATGLLSATDGSNSVSLAACGLGDETSFVALNDERLVSVDLNPNTGRTLDVQFADTAEGIVVSFEPELDLSVAVALTHLSDSLRVDLPDWLSDEIFDVTFGGDPKPSVLIRRPECLDGVQIGDSQVQVTQGTLAFAATSLGEPVTVEAGMCVIDTDSSEEDPHPFTTIAAGICE